MIINKHIIDNTERTDMAKFYEALKVLPCGRYEVYTCAIKPTRSARQRKYYWAVIVKMISDHTGYQKDEVNEILKFRFNQKEIMLPNGLYQKYGSSIEREKKGRVEELYEQIRIWANQEMDLQIPPPEKIPNEMYVKLANEE